MSTPPPEIVRTEAGDTAMVWRRPYPDPVEDVWAAVTDPERLGRWVGTWTGEPRVGGTVAFTMTGELDAGAVLVFAQSLPDGQRRPDVEAGWRWYLDRLAASLRDDPMPAWEEYLPAD